MPETTNTGSHSRRKLLIGQVVSTKMAKTIVVEVGRQKAHPLYRRVVARSKKFYAHDEEQSAHLGDFVRIEETRPLSRLKRWRLKDVLRRAELVTDEPKQDNAELS
jgi:small subunit ribosomal protein S17